MAVYALPFWQVVPELLQGSFLVAQGHAVPARSGVAPLLQRGVVELLMEAQMALHLALLRLRRLQLVCGRALDHG